MTENISDDDDSNLTDGSSPNDDAPTSFDAYTKEYRRTSDHKGKGPARKCWFPPPSQSLRFIYFLCLISTVGDEHLLFWLSNDCCYVIDVRIMSVCC